MWHLNKPVHMGVFSIVFEGVLIQNVTEKYSLMVRNTTAAAIKTLIMVGSWSSMPFFTRSRYVLS